MHGVILDAASLGDTDLTPVTNLLDSWQVYDTTRPDETRARVQDATVVLSNKIVLNNICLIGSSVKFISVMATGTNNIDLAYTRANNIVVSNAVAYATPSVVQHTIALILSLATSLPRYLNDVREGAWQNSPVFCRLDHPIIEIAGKKLGIIGFGELGSHVARAAEGLGMEIIRSARPAQADVADRMPFTEVLKEADFVSLHCPLTPETEKLINRGSLALMKPGAFLINTARGGLVDSTALLESLDTGHLAGAAVDVLETEPASIDEPLIQRIIHAKQRPNLLVTPHNAWGARESRQRLITQMCENIEAFIDGNPIRTVG